jgi:hypothetical protein
MTERSCCVQEFARCNSFVDVQRAFRRQFGRRGHYMKLQTFLFQMVVTSCISFQYLWKYGFAKYSDNLYAPCIYIHIFYLLINTTVKSHLKKHGRTSIFIYVQVFVCFLKMYEVELPPSWIRTPTFPPSTHILHRSTVQHMSKTMKTLFVLGLKFL